MYIRDDFNQLVGVGDIIVYATSVSSRPYLNRAEVLEIFEYRTWRQITPTWGVWSDYKMTVLPEKERKGKRRKSTLTRAPFIKVADGINFDDYVESLRRKYDEDHDEPE